MNLDTGSSASASSGPQSRKERGAIATQVSCSLLEDDEDGLRHLKSSAMQMFNLFLVTLRSWD
jgi:hypothetical protein